MVIEEVLCSWNRVLFAHHSSVVLIFIDTRTEQELNSTIRRRPCVKRRRALGPGDSFSLELTTESMRSWSLQAYPGDEPAAMSTRALPSYSSLSRVIIAASYCTTKVSTSSNQRRYIFEKKKRKQETRYKRETKKKREAHKMSSFREIKPCQNRISRQQI